MARKKSTSRPSITGATVTAADALRLIKGQMERGRALLEDRPIRKERYRSWENTTRDYLAKAFGEPSENVDSFYDIGKYGAFAMYSSEADLENQRAGYLNEKRQGGGATTGDSSPG